MHDINAAHRIRVQLDRFYGRLSRGLRNVGVLQLQVASGKVNVHHSACAPFDVQAPPPMLLLEGIPHPMEIFADTRISTDGCKDALDDSSAGRGQTPRVLRWV